MDNIKLTPGINGDDTIDGGDGLVPVRRDIRLAWYRRNRNSGVGFLAGVPAGTGMNGRPDLPGLVPTTLIVNNRFKRGDV
mgnify:CR=1 FL=1